ncbi:MAG: hypothetical protein QW796_07550, partial [Thermoproteota archaeon]
LTLCRKDGRSLWIVGSPPVTTTASTYFCGDAVFQELLPLKEKGERVGRQSSSCGSRGSEGCIQACRVLTLHGWGNPASLSSGDLQKSRYNHL